MIIGTWDSLSWAPGHAACVPLGDRALYYYCHYPLLLAAQFIVV